MITNFIWKNILEVHYRSATNSYRLFGVGFGYDLGDLTLHDGLWHFETTVPITVGQVRAASNFMYEENLDNPREIISRPYVTSVVTQG